MTYDVKDIADYFLWLDSEREGDGISNMKLQKLAYYAQGFHLALFETPLFDDRVEAWDHGPVVPPLYGLYKGNGKSPIPAPEGFDREVLSRETRDLLDEVFDVYGRYSAWHLREMTHDETPWKAHYSADRATSPIIPDDEMISFFRTKVRAD